MMMGNISNEFDRNFVLEIFFKLNLKLNKEFSSFNWHFVRGVKSGW